MLLQAIIYTRLATITLGTPLNLSYWSGTFLFDLKLEVCYDHTTNKQMRERDGIKLTSQ